MNDFLFKVIVIVGGVLPVVLLVWVLFR